MCENDLHQGINPEKNNTSTPSHKSSDNCLNRIGHYANLCLSKKRLVNSVEEKGNSNPYLLMIDAKCNTVSFPKPLVNATVQPFTVNNSSNVLFKVDTRADVSILCKPTYVNTFQDAKLIGLDKSAIVLTAYGGTDMEVLGSVTAKITVRGNTSSVKFIITDTLSPNILSYKYSMKLQLVHRINSLSVLDKTVIIDKYPHVFCDDFGSLPGEYTIQLKPNAQPVQQPPRPVPVWHLQQLHTCHRRTDPEPITRRLEKWSQHLQSVPHRLPQTPSECLASGASGTWTEWRCLNRLRTKMVCCKRNLRTWKYTDEDDTTCNCKETDQTMEHLLECPLLRQTCSLDDLMVYNDVAK